MVFTPDSEVFARLAELFGAGPPPKPGKVGDVEARRQMVAGTFGHLAPAFPADVTKKDYTVAGSDGHQIKCRLYEKKGAPKNGAGVLYLHGGGYIAGDGLDLYDGIVANYVTNTGVPLFAPDYRLAPESQYPTNVDDAHKALLYLFENASEFGIDSKRIAVMGDSGGGGLSAALVHYNIEKGGPQLAKQILIYPMLDDRNINPDPSIEDYATWKSGDNLTGWDAILGSNRGKPDVKPSAAPARMTDATGLPTTFIDVGELDIFRDEDIEYAKKIINAGISCELHVYPGCIHAFELMAPQANVSQRAMQSRFQAVKTIESVGEKTKL